MNLTYKSLLLGVSLMCAVLDVRANAPVGGDSLTVAEVLSQGYRELDTITCEIRKTTRAGNRATRLLSRIFYARPRRIHVENMAPSRRRIISNGERLYYHEHGNPRGFSKPIDELTGEWLAAVDNVPATPIEHLVNLIGIAEQPLPTGPGGEQRVGYAVSEDMFVVLVLDKPNRLTAVEFYASAAMERLSAEFRYDHFEEVVPGCWIPLRHQGKIHLPDGTTVEETRQITNLSVNEPIAPALFNPAGFFEGVEFVGSYRATLAP